MIYKLLLSGLCVWGFIACTADADDDSGDDAGAAGGGVVAGGGGAAGGGVVAGGGGAAGGGVVAGGGGEAGAGGGVVAGGGGEAGAGGGVVAGGGGEAGAGGGVVAGGGGEAGAGGGVVAGGGGEAGGAGEDEPCGDITFLGQCVGDVLEWCSEEGFLQRTDCSEAGVACVLVDEEYGYDCEMPENPDPDPECADLDYLGRCNGTVAEWCENGYFLTHDCAEEATTCDFINDADGYWCVEPEGA